MGTLRYISAAAAVFLCAGILSCSRVSPTVTPDPLEEIVTAGDLGSLFPQIQDVSPGEIDSLDVNPTPPAGISASNPGISVIFSRIMENDGDEMYFSLELIEDPNGAATSVPYTISPASTSSTVFTLTPLTALSESIEYTVRIHDTAAEDDVPAHTLKFDNLADMYPAASALSPADPTYVDYIFETGSTASADTTLPTVSAVVPNNLATGVTPDLDPNGYIDFTLTDDTAINPVTVSGATISLYNTTDSLPVTGTLQIMSTTNYRVSPDEALDYDKTYRFRISVGGGITDTSGNSMTQVDYTFSTESAASVTDPVIDSYEVTGVTDTSATITWSTSINSITHVELDAASAFGTADVIVHDTAHAVSFTETVSGLTPNTLYSIEFAADNETPAAVDTFDNTTTVDGAFRTLPDSSEGATGNYEVEASGTAKSGVESYQLSSDESFLFWKDTTAGEVRGQYLDSSAGPADTWDRWPDSTSNTGSQVFSSAGDVALAAGTDNDVYALMTDGSGGIYGELVYDNAGSVGRRWGGGAAGVNLYSGTADETSAALSYSGYVTSITTGTASLDFIYDDAVDFFGSAAVGDHLINEAAGDHTTVSAVLDDGVNSHLLILGAPIISSGAGNQAYRIGDALTTESGNSVRAGTAAVVYTDNGLLDTGDVLFLDRDGGDTDSWLYLVSGATWNAGPGDFSYNVNLSITYDASSDTLTTYDFIANGTADTNWLYENSKDFTTAGGGVSAGDVVINTSTGEADQVHADVVAPESDDVLKLENSGKFIFDTDGEGYQILRLSDSSSFLASGRNSAFTASTVTDSDEDFSADGVEIGDIIYNITTDRYAEVTSVAATVLGISESVFTAANQLFIVFRFTGLTLTWSEGGDILGKTVDGDDGSFLYPAPGAVGTSFTITNTATACSNPFSVADMSGNVIVVYQYNNGADSDIRVKKIKSDGSFVWSDPADDDTDAGISLLATGRDDLIQEVMADGYGGAWVVYTSHDATLRVGVVHIQDDGTVSTMPASAGIVSADYPAAVRLSGTDNMVLVYESIQTFGVSTVRRIYGIKFQTTGGNPTLVAGSSMAITASSDAVSQINPRVLDDLSGGYVVSWLDMMYYPSAWYTLFTEHIDSGNSRQYGTTGRFGGMPVRLTPGDDNPYTLIEHLMLNYDNGNGTEDAGIIFWLDERNGAGTTDIYMQDVVD